MPIRTVAMTLTWAGNNPLGLYRPALVRASRDSKISRYDEYRSSVCRLLSDAGGAAQPIGRERAAAPDAAPVGSGYFEAWPCVAARFDLWLPIMTICVWVAIATRVPSRLLTVVCHTMVVRPMCSGMDTPSSF